MKGCEGKSVDEASKTLTSEFSAKYRDSDQPARIAGAVAVCTPSSAY